MPLTLRSGMAFTHQRAHACWGQYSGHEHSQKHDRRCGSVGHFRKLYLRPHEMRKLEQGLLPYRGSVLIAGMRPTSGIRERDGWAVAHPLRYLRNDDSGQFRKTGGSLRALIRKEFQNCGWSIASDLGTATDSLTHLCISTRQRSERPSACLFLHVFLPSRNFGGRRLRARRVGVCPDLRGR